MWASSIWLTPHNEILTCSFVFPSLQVNNYFQMNDLDLAGAQKQGIF